MAMDELRSITMRAGNSWTDTGLPRVETGACRESAP